jgi:zinc protease
MAFSGGLLAETQATSGLTSMVSRLLLKGTRRRSAIELATEIESLGGSLEPYGGNHSFGASAEVLSGDFAQGLDLLADVILHPAWPADAIEREREVQLASLRGQRDQLLQCAFKGLRRGLFGDNGYGLDSLGSESNVRRFVVQDIDSFYRHLAVPNNAVLSIFGDIHADAVRAEVEHAFRDWQPGAVFGHQSTQPVLHTARIEEAREKEQAVIALGFTGSTFDAADRPALELLQEACSDMGSRLFMRIRDELGLAYYVGASNFLGRTPGYFAFYCGTAPDEVDRVDQELRAQADALRTAGLTEEELTRAKAKLVGQKKIARQDLGHLALSAALDELYGLGYAHGDKDDERYEAVTAEDIRAAAQRYLKPESAVVSIIRGRSSAKP